MTRRPSRILETGAKVLRLNDGRALGYAEYGDVTAWPVLLFQGTPTSRLPHNPLDTSAPVRIVVPERPGFGCSDFLRRRKLLDWPSDVRELVDHLGIQRFSVVGVSGGAPHALACGLKLSHRISRLGIVSGIGPLDASDAKSGMAAQRKAGAWVARHAPFVLRPLFWAIRNPARNPERFVQRFSEGFSPSDRELLKNRLICSLRARSYAEATRSEVRDLPTRSRFSPARGAFRCRTYCLATCFYGTEKKMRALPSPWHVMSRSHFHVAVPATSRRGTLRRRATLPGRDHSNDNVVEMRAAA